MSNLLYLPDWTVTEYEIDSDGAYRIPASYDTAPDHCEKCGAVGNLYKHGTKKTVFVDAPVHGRQTFIEVTRLRFRCRDCGGTFMQPLPDMDDTRRMTVRCRDYIARQALLKPNTHVAEDVGVNEKVIRQISSENSEVLLAEHFATLRAPRVLGIDELKIGKEMRAIFTDVETSWPIELLPGRSSEEVVHFLGNLPGRKETEVVTIDMWRPYREAVAYAMPQAVIVVDKWHVLRIANDAMETARRRYQGLLKDKDRRELKRGKAIFLKAPYNLTDSELLNLDGWLKNVPELRGAYETKEAFKAIWKHKNSDDAKEALHAWRAGVPKHLLNLFRPAMTATKNWEREVLNYFDHGRFTNAPTEARNRVIKMTNRLGAGYSFDAIRARALLGKRPGRVKAEKIAAEKARKASMVECDICKALFEPSGLEVSHVTPISAGGSSGPENRMRVCPECHRFHTKEWFKPHDDSTPLSE
ncbi:ISL3 family transposase [Pseudooceanicola atlanticus]|uniref:ISL3 family transposase n=1 Tax=Pseudooceanicola atlanticus TaxID=1461694 RepID=UPI0023571B19|nr:ISL3 family transposase [Pseudooceanicola atlanticus]